MFLFRLQSYEGCLILTLGAIDAAQFQDLSAFYFHKTLSLHFNFFTATLTYQLEFYSRKAQKPPHLTLTNFVAKSKVP